MSPLVAHIEDIGELLAGLQPAQLVGMAVHGAVRGLTVHQPRGLAGLTGVPSDNANR
ncbi:hypothetical protein [Streptomyces chartreusis]|uniref:hypothetical protein n=1 Tax=Streptomyces chartreusis TaxID=1969 RepID=UPI00369497F2